MGHRERARAREDRGRRRCRRVAAAAAVVRDVVQCGGMACAVSRSSAEDTPLSPPPLSMRSLLDDEVGITTCSWNAATRRGEGETEGGTEGVVRQTSPLWGVPKDILPTDRIAAARALLAGYVIVCTYSRNIRAPS